MLSILKFPYKSHDKESYRLTLQRLESKGFFKIADEKSEKLERVLLKASDNGKYPILSDTSPCLYRMKRAFKLDIKLHDSVEFTHDFLLDHLKFRQVPETVAVHVTCSSVKMHISDKFKTVAEACAQKVIMPDDVQCCYSNSRTCEIGLSLRSGITINR